MGLPAGPSAAVLLTSLPRQTAPPLRRPTLVCAVPEPDKCPIRNRPSEVAGALVGVAVLVVTPCRVLAASPT